MNSNQKPRIAVLCNHPLAFPSIEALLKSEVLVGLGTPQIMHETSFRIQMIADEKKIPFVMVDPSNTAKSIGDWLNKCKADVVFVITFPYKIPEKVLKIPKYGFFNWHTGMLPAYKGADPIFWMDKEKIPFDSKDPSDLKITQALEVVNGAIAVKITQEDTYGQHIQKLAIAAKKSTDFMLGKFLINPQEIILRPQDKSRSAYQPKPDFSHLLINWETMPSAQIKSLIRATNPVYGGAITFFRGVPVHLLQVSIGSAPNAPKVKPGSIISSGAKEGIVVLCNDNKLLRLDVLYTEDGFFTGGKLASIFDIKEGEVFTSPPPNPFAEGAGN
jgi:methionyl-tRNA formyltransferase